MNAHNPRTPTRGDNFFTSAFTLLFLVVLAFGFASGTAQEPAQGGEAKEREIEIRMAAHLPFKAKLRNLEKMKDLKNEDWIGDLEFEITNTGTKPIYELSFVMMLPAGVTTLHDGGIAYDVAYGRIELASLREPVRSDDVPILPGESVVIKLPVEKVDNWKSLRAKGKYHNPKKLEIWFQGLNHGDGTGFLGPTGLPLPNRRRRPTRSSRPHPSAQEGHDERSETPHAHPTVQHLRAASCLALLSRRRLRGDV